MKRDRQTRATQELAAGASSKGDDPTDPAFHPGSAQARSPDASILAALASADRAQRWRLLLGTEGAQQAHAEHLPADLPAALQEADDALAALYPSAGAPSSRAGNLASSRPRLNRWLQSLDTLFPESIARSLRGEAISRHRLEALLLEPALLQPLAPDAALVAQLIELAQRLPEPDLAAAKLRITELVESLSAELEPALESSVGTALRQDRRGPLRSRRALDVPRTVRANLRHWDPITQRLGISRLRFHGAASHGLPFRLILALDTSGSMEASQVHGAITASVLARLPMLDTRVVLFDAAVVEVPRDQVDPVDLLLSARLGGGTDLAGALGHCAGLVEDPSRTLLVLISDLQEGGRPDAFLGQLARMKARGVRCLCLLALEDRGRDTIGSGDGSAFHAVHAAAVRSLRIPTLAITPDRIPEVLGAALRGDSLADSDHDPAVTT